MNGRTPGVRRQDQRWKKLHANPWAATPEGAYTIKQGGPRPGNREQCPNRSASMGGVPTTATMSVCRVISGVPAPSHTGSITSQTGQSPFTVAADDVAWSWWIA